MTPRAAPRARTETLSETISQRALRARGTALAAVWTATVLMSLLAPDLVSDDGARHVPLAACTSWVWAGVATVFLRLSPSSRLTRETVALILGAWGVALFLSVTAPELVVSSGAIEIPVTACVAPALASVLTGYAVLASLVHARGPSPGLRG